MVVFNDFWSLVKDRGRVAHFYRTECETLWNDFTPEQQQAICTNIERKILCGAFVHYVPTKAMQDNAPRKTGPQIMTFDQYYRIYHTTEERDGWHMANPTGQKVIYIR